MMYSASMHSTVPVFMQAQLTKIESTGQGAVMCLSCPSALAYSVSCRAARPVAFRAACLTCPFIYNCARVAPWLIIASMLHCIFMLRGIKEGSSDVRVCDVQLPGQQWRETSLPLHLQSSKPPPQHCSLPVKMTMMCPLDCSLSCSPEVGGVMRVPA